MTDYRRLRPRKLKIKPYSGPAGGWGSLKSLASVALRARDMPIRQLLRQNKTEGFMCVSCAWPKPAHSHPAEFCENGAKATFWDLTRRRAGPEVFAAHTVTELLTWSDFDL